MIAILGSEFALTAQAWLPTEFKGSKGKKIVFFTNITKLMLYPRILYANIESSV